ncbi:hypothetical protein RJT34_31850 [Clitoria ternatea]|uniref:Mei2-like C-terminal RNA recognition motif domain-containing protein n=1 Tax=Clitoria ternatea TaxID=43366 RepID=A0AAN9EW98_CLITE
MLVEFLENHCKKENEKEKKEAEQNIIAFDFVYLPIDFITGFNKGYAFVNFTNPKAALKFFSTASNAKWSLFQSHKTREVVAARLQGKEQLEKHFEAMNFPCISEGVLPVSFSPPRDGVIKGKQRTIGKVMRRWVEPGHLIPMVEVVWWDPPFLWKLTSNVLSLFVSCDISGMWEVWSAPEDVPCHSKVVNETLANQLEDSIVSATELVLSCQSLALFATTDKKTSFRF